MIYPTHCGSPKVKVPRISPWSQLKNLFHISLIFVVIGPKKTLHIDNYLVKITWRKIMGNKITGNNNEKSQPLFFQQITQWWIWLCEVDCIIMGKKLNFTNNSITGDINNSNHFSQVSSLADVTGNIIRPSIQCSTELSQDKAIIEALVTNWEGHFHWLERSQCAQHC